MRIRLVVLGLSAFATTAANAGMILLDPALYAPGTNVSNVSTGAVLSSYSMNFDYPSTSPIFDPLYVNVITGGSLGGQMGFFAAPASEDWFSDTNAVAQYNFFVREGIPIESLPPGTAPSFRVIRADFASPSSKVEILGAALPNGELPSLRAFDAQGNTLAQCDLFMSCAEFLGIPSGSITRDQYGGPWRLTIDTGAFNIAYVVAGSWEQGASSYSQFRYSVPEPGTMGLLSLGIAGLFCMGRRKPESRMAD